MLYSPLVPARQYCRRDQRRGHDGVTSTIARLLPQEKKNTQRTQRLSRSHLTSACCSWRDAGRTAAAKQRKGGVFEAVPGAERPSLTACGSGGLIRRRYGLSIGAACPYTNHYYVFAAGSLTFASVLFAGSVRRSSGALPVVEQLEESCAERWYDLIRHRVRCARARTCDTCPRRIRA